MGKITDRSSVLSTRDRAIQEGDNECSHLDSTGCWGGGANFMDNAYLIIDYISFADLVVEKVQSQT